MVRNGTGSGDKKERERNGQRDKLVVGDIGESFR